MDHQPDDGPISADARTAAYRVLAGVEDPSMVAARCGVDEATVAHWVSVVDKAADMALVAEANGRYMSGEFFQLSRLVSNAAVSLHSLDQVECFQGPPDDNGVSQIRGVARRVVDNIEAGPDRQHVTTPGEGLQFAFEGRCASGKATGVYWSCDHAHESRGTFMLNSFSYPGHGLAGCYTRMDLEADPKGDVLSVSITPIVAQLFWVRRQPEDDWRQFLSKAVIAITAAPPAQEEPGKLRKVAEFGREALDFGQKHITRFKERREGPASGTDAAEANGHAQANGNGQHLADKEDKDAR